MSAAHIKGVALYAVVFVLVTTVAHAQQAQPQHMPTLADCPVGYVLTVQDTALPQPLAKLPSAQANPDDTSLADPNALAAAEAAQQAMAPRQFVTGCVPPQYQPNR
jgi:hypothetical protein